MSQTHRGGPVRWKTSKLSIRSLASFTSSAINNDADPFSDDAGKPSEPEHPLAHKTMIVCATKIDSANPEKLKKLAGYVKRKKLDLHAISAVTGEGIERA